MYIYQHNGDFFPLNDFKQWLIAPLMIDWSIPTRVYYKISLTRRHHTLLVHGTQTECKHTSTTNLKQETRKNIHITVDIFITTLIYDKTNADSPCPLSAGYSLQIFTVRSSLHEASLWPSASKHKLHTVDVCPCKVARHSQSSSSSL